jgi:hypothetical protein
MPTSEVAVDRTLTWPVERVSPPIGERITTVTRDVPDARACTVTGTMLMCPDPDPISGSALVH